MKKFCHRSSANGIDFENNSSFAVEIDSSVPSADSLIVNTAGVTIGTGVTLVITDFAGVPAALAPGTELTIVDYSDTTTLSGTFDGLAEGATITVGSNELSTSYTGGAGARTYSVRHR